MKSLDISKLVIQPYGTDRVAVGWLPENDHFLNLFINFGATDSPRAEIKDGQKTGNYIHNHSSEVNSTGVFQYITLTKETIIRVFRDFALMHSIRNQTRRSVKNAQARAESQFKKIKKLDFVKRDYGADGLLNQHKIGGAQFDGCDDSNPWESYTQQCVLG